MNNIESPLWQVMASPTSSNSELTELRHTLSTSALLNQQLQKFLYSEYMLTHAKARQELNPEVRTQYLHYADALAELAGKLFSEYKPKPTTKMPPL